jgi:hypothetical protein
MRKGRIAGRNSQGWDLLHPTPMARAMGCPAGQEGAQGFW